LDYELEVGIIITKKILNSNSIDAKEAIGGFLLFNVF
jgi:2-keto-4-pentenoate hydratase/2-oxohepta-3-ene-1,7-dioic acid hydratase in catechol pathway